MDDRARSESVDIAARQLIDRVRRETSKPDIIEVCDLAAKYLILKNQGSSLIPPSERLSQAEIQRNYRARKKLVK